ncbi:hypothetical protein BpHYR1_047511 [Brachionus plicatilis]|uniref:Uncharacterized protein n=1 Tax=Brachionus plicatilis TaxID=10195 RepID=A0A3M7PPY7_BRAPC|nr:hypothetical protein BpHYR1_047511 [Brachionus plicatilis]
MFGMSLDGSADGFGTGSTAGRKSTSWVPSSILHSFSLGFADSAELWLNLMRLMLSGFLSLRSEIACFKLDVDTDLATIGVGSAGFSFFSLASRLALFGMIFFG